MNRRKEYWISIGVAAVVLLVVFLYATRPQHDRNWESGQEVLPRIIVEEGKVKIEGVRDFSYGDDGSVTSRYITKEFFLKDISSTDVIISHFSDFEGLAHIFLSFPIGGGEYVNVSVETRRETDEEFSPYWGMFRKFELIYVVGMERDVLGVRTDIRGERVYLYPTVATPEQSQQLFLALTEEINSVYAEPEVYNTVFNNCTNAITRQVEDIADVDFPVTYKMLLPGYVDEVLYDMSLISTESTFDKVKEQHRLRPIRVDRNDSAYSTMLRESIATP